MPLIYGAAVTMMPVRTLMHRVSLHPGAELLRQKYAQPFTFVLLFRRLTWSLVGKITRWGLHSNANGFGNLSCLSHIPIQSWKIPQRLGIIPLARPPNVLGRGGYDEAQANHFWQ